MDLSSSSQRRLNIVSMTPSDLEASNEKVNAEEWKPKKAEHMVMVTLGICSLMVALDATILVSVLPTLAIDLHGSASEAFWAGTSYLLTNAVFQPFVAALSDIFGRQIFVLTSLFFFTIGSILCAVSQNFTQLLAGRVIQGIGGGGIITMSQVIFADIVPLRQRPKYFSIVLGAWAVGTVFGPLIGGAFVQKATWRWCFYINLPFCGVGFAMVFFFLRFSMEHSSMMSKLARVDWIGGFLFILSLTSFLIAISWGGLQYAWSSFQTLVPLILGACGLIIALAWEHSAKNPSPFLRKQLFKERDMIPAYLCAFSQGLLFLIALYYLPFYFTTVRFKSPIDSGVDILPGTLMVLPGSIVVSALITRLARFRPFVWTGFAVTTLGAGLMIMYDINTKTAVWVTILCIFGLGLGMILTSVNFAVQAIVDSEYAGEAAAMYAFMRALGMCLGVAIGGAAFQNLMRQQLQKLGLPTEIAKNAEAYVATLRTLSSTDPTRLPLLQSYVRGFKGVFEVMTAVAGIALLVSLLIKHHDMDKILISKHKVEK